MLNLASKSGSSTSGLSESERGSAVLQVSSSDDELWGNITIKLIMTTYELWIMSFADLLHADLQRSLHDLRKIIWHARWSNIKYFITVTLEDQMYASHE